MPGPFSYAVSDTEATVQLRMNSEKKSICCKEIAEIVPLLDEGDAHPECITEHQDFSYSGVADPLEKIKARARVRSNQRVGYARLDFSNVCLCRAVLTVALYSHRHRYGSYW